MSAIERQLLLDAFDSNWIAPLGPHVDAFESEFAQRVGATHAVALSSGTAALHLALLAVGVQPGDCVLTSTLTFAATANAIRYVGAEPVFIDSERKSWNLDPELLAGELQRSAQRGRLPAAVIVVDLFGQCADYQAINEVCRAYEVSVIEDAAESLGAQYHGQSAGTLADVGCYSFNGNKIITTSGGGMLTTERPTGPNEFVIWQLRLVCRGPTTTTTRLDSTIASAICWPPSAEASCAYSKSESPNGGENFRFYHSALGSLPGITFMPEFSGSRSNRWLTCILIDSDKLGKTAEEIRVVLESQNIESRSVWKPMHLQPVNDGLRYVGGRVAEDLFVGDFASRAVRI